MKNQAQINNNNFPLYPPPKKSKKKIVIIIISCILAFILLIGAFVFTIINFIKKSDAYKTAYEYIISNEYIIEKYGKNVEAEFCGGSINKSVKNGKSVGDANFTFKIEDEYYKVDLYCKDGVWHIEDVLYDSNQIVTQSRAELRNNKFYANLIKI